MAINWTTQMNKFLEMHKLQKQSQEEIQNLNMLLTSKEIKSVIKNLQKKSLGLDAFTGKLYQIFEEVTSILLKLFQKFKWEGDIFSYSMKPLYYHSNNRQRYPKKVICQHSL
jgi:hypothetical protein